MNNQLDFANRLQRLEGRKTFAISRSTNVDSAIAKDYSKKKKKKGGLSKWLLAKTFLWVVVGVLSFRAATIMMVVDLEKRRAQLESGSSGERIASVLVGATMLADPWLRPVLDKNNWNLEMRQGESGTNASTSMEASVTQEAIAIVKPEVPSMVVNAPNKAVTKAGLGKGLGATTTTKNVVREPIPVAKTMTDKVWTMFEPQHNKKPRLYLPTPADDWFLVTATDLKFEATPYFSQKNAWLAAAKSNPNQRKWEELPLLKGLLSEKGKATLDTYAEEFAWYVNKTSGEAILLKLFFNQRAVQSTDQSNKIAENVLSKDLLARAAKFRAANDLKVADVPYKTATIRNFTRIQSLNFTSASIREYKTELSRNVSIQAFATAPDKDVVSLLERIDYPTLVAIFQES